MRKFETVAVCLLEAKFDLESRQCSTERQWGPTAIRSDADSVPKIIAELVEVRNSERENRVIDHDREGSIELKKREGYF